MSDLIKSSANGNEVSGYLWDESKRKSDISIMKASDIVVGVIGSAFLLVFFVHGYAWLLGLAGVLLLMYIVVNHYRSPDINAVFTMNETGVVTSSRQKKYNKCFIWDEVVDSAEIIVVQSAPNFCHLKDYILLMKKPHVELNILIASDGEYAKENYDYLYRHPDIIAIPKTEETVKFITRFKTIQPLP